MRSEAEALRAIDRYGDTVRRICLVQLRHHEDTEDVFQTVFLKYVLHSPAFQSEEHWVFRMKEGKEDKRPQIGTMLYVIPTHICPTSALYSDILVAEGGKITAKWPVTARNRKINI